MVHEFHFESGRQRVQESFLLHYVVLLAEVLFNVELDADVKRLRDVLALSKLIQRTQPALVLELGLTLSFSFSESMEAIMEEKLPITNE